MSRSILKHLPAWIRRRLDPRERHRAEIQRSLEAARRGPGSGHFIVVAWTHDTP